MIKEPINRDINSLIIDFHWFEQKFILDFWSDRNTFKEFLNKKRYKISDKKLSTRVLNHWNSMGVLNDDRHEGKGWRRFSVSEMIWITIIGRLRSFGMDLNTIKKVREYLDSYSNKGNQSKCPLLDFYIAYGHLSKEPVRLIVFANGDSMLFRQSALDEYSQQGHILDDYISIDINALFSKGVGAFSNETEYSLSNVQKEVQEALTIKDIKSLTITVRDSKYIIKKEMLMKDRASARALMNILDYAKLEEQKYDKIYSFKVTEEKIMSKQEGKTLKKKKT